MSRTPNIDFGPYYLQIKQSIYRLEEAVSASSPIQHPPSLSFKQTAHDRNNSQAMSIQDDLNTFESHNRKFKCFRCVGIQSQSNMQCSAPLCQECDGTEQITDAHPIVSIFDQILRAKLPFLKNGLDQDSHSITCLDSESICKHCKKVLENQQGLICQTCQDYSLCVTCFDQVPNLHYPTHRFMKKTDHGCLVRLKQNIPAMKKISEEYQSEEVHQQQIKCTNCEQEVEECYEACLDCSANGHSFILCGKCSQMDLPHDLSHSLTMKTVSKNSQLENIFQKENQSGQINLAYSMQYQQSPSSPSSPSSPTSVTKTDANQLSIMQNSLVNIPEITMQNSQQMQQEHIITNNSSTEGKSFTKYCSTQSIELQHQPWNPESQEIGKGQSKRQTKYKRNQSIVQISMDQSMEKTITPKIAIKGVNFQEQVTFLYNSQSRSHKILIDQQEQYVFNNYMCDICGILPIKNKRYHCRQCEDYDICHDCFTSRTREHQHADYEVVDGKNILKQKQQRFNKVAEGLHRYSTGVTRKNMRGSQFH